MGDESTSAAQGFVNGSYSHDARCEPRLPMAHYPAVVTSSAVPLKARNREMCGLQFNVSCLLYACHCEKQVKHQTYILNRVNHKITFSCIRRHGIIGIHRNTINRCIIKFERHRQQTSYLYAKHSIILLF